MIEQGSRTESEPRTSPAFAVATTRASTTVTRTRTYYRVEVANPGHAPVTALVGADVSGRTVDFDGLVWCKGDVLFEWIGSFSFDATSIQRHFEAALTQRLRAHLARAS